MKAGTDEFERQLNIFKSVCPFSHKFQQSLQKRDPEAFANYEAWKMEKDGPDHCKCRQGTAAKSLTALLQHAEANSASLDMDGLEECHNGLVRYINYTNQEHMRVRVAEWAKDHDPHHYKSYTGVFLSWHMICNISLAPEQIFAMVPLQGNTF